MPIPRAKLNAHHEQWNMCLRSVAEPLRRVVKKTKILVLEAAQAVNTMVKTGSE